MEYKLTKQEFIEYCKEHKFGCTEYIKYWPNKKKRLIDWYLDFLNCLHNEILDNVEDICTDTSILHQELDKLNRSHNKVINAIRRLK